MNISEQRQECGWSPEQAADACGVSLEAWNALEGGSVLPHAAYPWSSLVEQWERVYLQRMFDRHSWIDGSDTRPRGF